MRTDIAIGQRTENGIDQRMQADVAIGMGEETAVMRHANTANHEVIALAERVDVITGPGSDVPELACQARFLAEKILRRRQFHVRSIALKSRHLQSRPFRK